MRKKYLINVSRVLIISLLFCFMPIKTLAAENVYTGYILNTNYVLTFIPHNDFGTQTIQDFNDALYQWNHALGFTLLYRDPTSRHSKTDYPSNDDQSYIYRIKDSRGYLAANATFNSFLSNVIKSVDINFNMNNSFSNSGGVNTYDVWSVFLHEAGHAAGLNDLYENSHMYCAMYYTLDTGVLRRAPSLYDITNIINRYN